jgi:hypothetical protein
MDENKELTEIVQVRFPRGLSKRIDKVLYGGELRSAFIRVAVMAELKRREASASGRSPSARSRG